MIALYFLENSDSIGQKNECINYAQHNMQSVMSLIYDIAKDEMKEMIVQEIELQNMAV